MTDDKTKTAAGRKRIDVHEDYELRYWTQNLASQKSSWKPPFGKSARAPRMSRAS